jgi:hypothetical protein
MSLPNENSEGKPITNNIQSLKNFWAWFKGSKVIDSKGRPLVVYHATNNDFDTFDIGRAFGVAGQGVYTTHIRPSNDKYGNFVMILYASIKNPVDFRAGDTVISDIAESYGMMRLSELSSFDQIKEWSKTLRDNLKTSGYDGALVRGEREDESYYVAFDNTQVKSVIGNKGTFNQDIGNMIDE